MGQIYLNSIPYAGGGGSYFSPIIYSTEERSIGTWVDGKPLYEKTVHFGSLPSNASKNVAHNISNFEMLISLITTAKASNGTCYFIPHTVTRSSDAYYQLKVNVDATNITIETGTDRTTLDAYCTLRYTKTTDSAGSGMWTLQGVPAAHYSTSEQIIGTWIDGSTLYEKTVEFGALPNATGKSVNHNISNLKTVVDARGFARNTTQGYRLPIPHSHRNNVNAQIQLEITNSTVDIYTGTDRSGYTESFITIRYTKTT